MVAPSDSILIADEQAKRPIPSVIEHTTENKIRHRTYSPGSVLFNIGERHDSAYLIEAGEVHIVGEDERGRDKFLCSLSEGELFGEMSLIDDSPRTAKAVCVNDTVLYVIPREALEQRLNGLDPVVSLLITLLIERYRFARIHMPEAIKQERSGDFFKKFTQHEDLDIEPAAIQQGGSQKDQALQEIKLEEEITTALEQNQFVPYLQPIIKLPEERIAGFEALIRWHHPEKGLIMPDKFIDVAERAGYIQQIDNLMLVQACDIVPQLNKMAPFLANDPIKISVNLSGANLSEVNLINTMRALLIEKDIDPKQIQLELTESSLVENPKQADKVLRGLKALGFVLALDDFGTGYSSLSYLHEFSIDTLKIDRAFVSRIHECGKSLDIVRAIIALSHNFKLRVVAEGVEEASDVEILKKLGCEMAQGYYYGKAMPVPEAFEYTKKNLTEFLQKYGRRQ